MNVLCGQNSEVLNTTAAATTGNHSGVTVLLEFKGGTNISPERK